MAVTVTLGAYAEPASVALHSAGITCTLGAAASPASTFLHSGGITCTLAAAAQPAVFDADILGARIVYHVYANTGAGDAVNYTTPVASVTGTSWNTFALAQPSNWTFAVRAYDAVTGLEEYNVDARVQILVGSTGLDLTGLPNAPSNLTASPRAAGTATVLWTYNPGGQGASPQGFHVYVGTPTVSYATPVATVPYASALAFQTTISGLLDQATYKVGVRAYNASGEESNTTVVSLTALISGPSPVTGLTATIIS